MKKRKVCMECNSVMHKAKSRIKGIDFELYECPKCRSRVFTEEQVTLVTLTLDSQKLKKQYPKKPIRIGHSLGITFPKGLVDVFRIDGNKTKITLIPKLKENIIEIKIE